MNFIQRWRHSYRYRQGLDILLSEAPLRTSPLRERVDWLSRLVNWVRITGTIPPELGISRTGRIQTTRLKFILQVLENNPEYKKNVSDCLRSIMSDTRSIELFMHVGVPNQQGFVGEFIERASTALLPQAPDDQNLEFIFSETFRYKSDAEWINEMDPVVFKGWVELFSPSQEFGSSEPQQGKVQKEIQDALFLLSHSVRSIGLSRLVRNRVAENDFRKLAFFELTDKVESLIKAHDHASRNLAFASLNETLDRCFVVLSEVYSHYRDHGVSIELVYQTERLKALLRRCLTLGKLLVGNEENTPFIQSFFGLLVLENIRARKLGTLLSDNLVLVCQKIVETNAETGEHYITRSREAYIEILKQALGGGAVTAVTTFVKFLLAHLHSSLFFSGFLAFTNYSVSFLSLQFLGFTLATKQPAMTATVLASKLEESSETTDGMDGLTEEIIHLIRSQFAAVLGNLMMVVPVVIIIDFVYAKSGSHLTDAAHGIEIIESFSILGMTPIYAAGTGVLLWLSSVFAGAFGNWFNFRGLPQAFEHNVRFKYVVGVHRAQRFARFLKNNVSGIAASISLAFLLGMTPQFASFFGFPFDVRHVTLSSGAMTASVMAIGPEIFSSWSFWLAVLGIASMAILNLGVSFVLALTVAIWSKKCSAPKRKQIYKALMKKFRDHPSVFLIPEKNI